MANRGEVRVSKELLEEHEHLSHEAKVQAAKLAPMHIVDWAEAQEADAALAACHKWLRIRKDTPLPKQDAILKMCLGMEAKMKQGKMLFCIRNSLVGHQGQQRTLALAQERFWWPMMAKDCSVLVRGCLHYQAFEEKYLRLCSVQ